MKKGCFIKSIVILTIIVGAVIYIVQYKLNDWLIEPTKKLVLSEVANNWENETAYIKESVEKDSLKSIMLYYLDNIKTMEEIVNLDYDIFLNEFNQIIDDSIITRKEISNLTLLLKKEKNEKSTSNRN